MKNRLIWKAFKSEEEWRFPLVPEIFKIFALCKLGTDDFVRCDSTGVKTQSREYLCK